MPKDELKGEHEEEAVESSEEEEEQEPSSSDEEAARERGRRRARRKKDGSTDIDSDIGEEPSQELGNVPDPAQAQGLLAASEEERKLHMKFFVCSN